MPSNPTDEQYDDWVVYMLRCADGSLYTGVTTNLTRRLREHNGTAAGARYTRARRPVQLVHVEKAANRSAACRREYQLKQLSRTEKETLISTDSASLTFNTKEV
ncbi:GIY-YIG nuclease family protein [Desulfopila aestuarii]|uniref:Putative endonuclease n=1 Tax=Desulfopila aestuarii DSM 18488 TaxID=1121416 RepID=A0A1M7YCW1_9BACT|nr:GIY-YIG nuclease family protein [Desulfopila aestuarii]SHO50474.1 putative endonuclease [Desulfopila aestuarii DSM 18488]